MKPILTIPFFTLNYSSKSIKLLGNKKFAFFCYSIFRKFINQSTWLNTGNFIIYR